MELRKLQVSSDISSPFTINHFFILFYFFKKPHVRSVACARLEPGDTPAIPPLMC